MAIHKTFRNRRRLLQFWSFIVLSCLLFASFQMDSDSNTSSEWSYTSSTSNTEIPKYDARKVLTLGATSSQDTAFEDNSARNYAFPEAQPVYEDDEQCTSHPTKVLSRRSTNPPLRTAVVYPGCASRHRHRSPEGSPPEGRAGSEEVQHPAPRQSEGCSSQNAGCWMTCSHCQTSVECPYCSRQLSTSRGSPQPSTSRGLAYQLRSPQRAQHKRTPEQRRRLLSESPVRSELTPVRRDRDHAHPHTRGDRTPGRTGDRAQARAQEHAQRINHPLVQYEGDLIRVSCPVQACGRLYINVGSVCRHIAEKHARIATPLKQQLEGIPHLDWSLKKCDGCGTLQNLKVSI